MGENGGKFIFAPILIPNQTEIETKCIVFYDRTGV